MYTYLLHELKRPAKCPQCKKTVTTMFFLPSDILPLNYCYDDTRYIHTFKTNVPYQESEHSGCLECAKDRGWVTEEDGVPKIFVEDHVFLKW